MKAQQPARERPHPSETTFEPAVIHEVDRDKTRTVFDSYLRQLSTQDRFVMALRLRGLQLRQVSKEAGISEKECRRSYARIRFLLQKMRLRGFSLSMSDLRDAGETGEDEHDG